MPLTVVESMSVDEFSLWVAFLVEQSKSAKGGAPVGGGGGSKAVRRKLR